MDGEDNETDHTRLLLFLHQAWAVGTNYTFDIGAIYWNQRITDQTSFKFGQIGQNLEKGVKLILRRKKGGDDKSIKGGLPS